MADAPSTSDETKVDSGPVYPDTLPLILLSDQVVFPGSIVPILINQQNEIELISDVAKLEKKLVGLVGIKNKESEQTGVDDAYEVGCIASALQVQQMPDGSLTGVFQILSRFRILGVVQREPYLIVKIETVESIPAPRNEIAPLVTTIKLQTARLISLSPDIPDSAKAILDDVTDPGVLADLVAGNMAISMEEKQKLLRTAEERGRLERLIYVLAREIEVLEVSKKIQKDVKRTIDKGQREYFLRQQLRAIQEELGEDDESRPEIAEYRTKIDKLGLKEDVKKDVLRELERLSQMQEASAEYHVITTYLDWIVDLPWNVTTEDQLDMDRAEKILNEDHYGLTKIKTRIIEYLAVRKLKADAAGPILCFVGPPGVGKTSLGKSIARALDRKFIRISLGGVRDEAEIRGHRKTYVGALPGRIIQNMRKAGSNNPVFMLDEIDKLGSDFRGDPSSALLEVLDPAQNDTFVDHYLSVPFDLTKVMFIATANVLDTIPWALRDRMEVIELPGYTLEEKMEIARKYLVPRQLEAHGIRRKQLKFSKAALREIIASYTREAGVRNLEREIANVCRATARAFVEDGKSAVSVKPDKLSDYLGRPKVFEDTIERTRSPGVAIGLAWTVTGGGILFIEATRMPGKGKLVLTGHLGEVMQESAQVVLSYIRANADRLKISQEMFNSSDIHVHVPQGAVPKDGPSAGVTIMTAITSLLTGKRVKSKLAMTGEMTLRGIVLPVGGIKEKILAAVRLGIKEIILPADNENDLEDVPETARNKVKFHFVKEISDVLTIALGIDA